MKKLRHLLLTFIALLFSTCSAAQEGFSIIRLGLGAYHDPDVYENDDGYHYILCTGSINKWPVKGKLKGRLLVGSTLGSLAQKDIFYHWNDSALMNKLSFIGVPTFHKNIEYYIYGSVHLGTMGASDGTHERKFIGVFGKQEGAQDWRAGEPISQWKFLGAVMGSTNWNSDTGLCDMRYISPWVYREEASSNCYLLAAQNYYDENENKVVIHKLQNATALDPTYTRRVLLEPEGLASEYRNIGKDGLTGLQLTEACSLYKINGIYVLLYCTGGYDFQSYKIGIAYSKTVDGVYTKVKAYDVNDVWENPTPTDEVVYLLQSKKPDWPNYCRSQVQAPGVANIVYEKGKYWLFFHGYGPECSPTKSGFPDAGYKRELFKAELEINFCATNWPPTANWIRVLDKE